MSDVQGPVDPATQKSARKTLLVVAIVFGVPLLGFLGFIAAAAFRGVQ